MSQNINPQEVLTYLNELGYTNISAQQLKEFMTDLNKLIKYENKLAKNIFAKENIDPVPNYSTNRYEAKCCNERSCSRNQSRCDDEIKQRERDIFMKHENKLGKNNMRNNNTEPMSNYLNNPYQDNFCNEPFSSRYYDELKQRENDIFNSLYSQPTVASKAKEVPRQERHISVHIVKPKSKSAKHDHCIHPGKEVTIDENQFQFVKNIGITEDGSRLQIETESTIRSVRPESKETISHVPSLRAARPKSSFIRPEFSKPINKCDPVALYHYYQNEWKKQKFPGQENHSELRWAVREKMLSGPKVDSTSRHSRPSSCRRSCNSWKG